MRRRKMLKKLSCWPSCRISKSRRLQRRWIKAWRSTEQSNQHLGSGHADLQKTGCSAMMLAPHSGVQLPKDGVRFPRESKKVFHRGLVVHFLGIRVATTFLSLVNFSQGRSIMRSDSFSNLRQRLKVLLTLFKLMIIFGHLESVSGQKAQATGCHPANPCSKTILPTAFAQYKPWTFSSSSTSLLHPKPKKETDQLYSHLSTNCVSSSCGSGLSRKSEQLCSPRCCFLTISMLLDPLSMIPGTWFSPSKDAQHVAQRPLYKRKDSQYDGKWCIN